MDAKDYDLIVLGAGPVGFDGARVAGLFGKRVAVIEKSPLVGGAAANTGTLPSKTLRETALALSGLKSRKLHGVDLSLRREVTVADLMRHEREVAATTRSLMTGAFTDYGIDLFIGEASFTDPNTIRVRGADGERQFTAPRILVATGSAPFRPPEFPFDHPRIYDSDGVLELERLPKSLAVVGGGVIGSEYACTFAALGVEVHLIDGKDILLPFLDEEVSRGLAAAMQKLGITFHWKQRVTKCDAAQSGLIALTFASGETLASEAVLVTAGRTSNTDALNLGVAGIVPGKRGLLVVDSHFRTNVPHIYAAGDVIGFPALASTGREQARVAICHAFDKLYKTEVSALLPYGIYTIPEASTVGATERELKEKGVDYVVGRARYAHNPRGVIVGDKSGFLKLLFRRGDMKLLGVHVLGELASEVVHIGVIAMQCDATIELFMRTCFNFPTLGDLYKQATADALIQVVRTGWMPKM